MCDTFVGQQFQQGSRSFMRSASWRQGEATDKQKAFVSKKLGADPESFLKRIGPHVAMSTLTRGQASHALALLQHGAKGRVEKLDKAYVKVQAKEMKENLKKARQVVKIGPLERGT